MTMKHKNFAADKIVAIEDMGEMQTYDFTIPGTHCFLANDVLVHNSGALEEHSDTVALLYWPKHNDFGYMDSNEFEINIAKQRHGPIGLLRLNFYPYYSAFEDRDEVVPI